MAGPLALNGNALNQLCKQHLKKLGQYPHPDCLHSMELVRWHLDLPKEEQPGYVAEYQEYLADQLAILLLPEDPEFCQRLLLNVEPWDVSVEEACLVEYRALRKLRPQEAACILVENLYNNLAENNPLLRPVV